MTTPRTPRPRSTAPTYVADRPCTTVVEPAPAVRGPEDVAPEFFRVVAQAAAAEREWFVAFYLDSRHHVIRAKVVSVGSLNASIVHPREVFREAIAVGSAALILAHNHPSGDPTPSEEDLAITRRLQEGGRMLGIELVDHLVVASPASWVSFRERRLLRV